MRVNGDHIYTHFSCITLKTIAMSTPYFELHEIRSFRSRAKALVSNINHVLMVNICKRFRRSVDTGYVGEQHTFNITENVI